MDTGGGGSKTVNFADVLYGWPLMHKHLQKVMHLNHYRPIEMCWYDASNDVCTGRRSFKRVEHVQNGHALFWA